MGIKNNFKIQTTQELHSEGWSTAKIANAKQNGELFQVFRGVYADHEVTPELVVDAVLKVNPEAVFEKRTALELYTGKPLTFPLQARTPSGVLLTGSRDLVVLRRSTIRAVQVCAGLPVVSVAEMVNSLLPERLNDPVPEVLIELMKKEYAGERGVKMLFWDLKNLGRISTSNVLWLNLKLRLKTL